MTWRTLLRRAALACLGAWGALGLAAGTAAAHPCPPFTSPTGSTVEQNFPSSGPMRTAWRVSYGHATGKGLYITGAWFKKSPTAPWMRVLWDARLADIFVPYHAGSPRYYDLTSFSFPLLNATATDKGPCGRTADGIGGKVVQEIVSTGLLWKDDLLARRGEEMALFATLDSANYNYIMYYGFRDDGTIALRLAATGRNLPGMVYMSHMHDGLWRIDMDLNGAASDSVYTASHAEAGLAATDTTVPFNGGVEGFVDVDPLKFTEVRVRDVSTNGNGKQIGYEFRPVRFGAPRHNEAFAKHDFWATQYDGALLYNLPAPVNGQPVMNTDVVIWHISPLHHEPRDEDGKFVGPFWRGVALVMWGGVDIRPRNLFDSTPLFPVP